MRLLDTPLCRIINSMITSLALALALSMAAASSDHRISKEALKIDVAILKEALTTIHGGLYRYQTPEQLEAGFRELNQKFANGATQAEVFLAVSEFTARIKCGHTFPSFWNNPVQTQRNLFLAKDKLPFCFRLMNGQMVVTRNDSTAPELTPGTIITEINDVPTAQIVTRLMKLVKGDGSNDAKRMAELQLQDLKQWEAFDIYFSLAFKPGSRFKLKCEGMDGTVQTVSVDAIDTIQRRKNRSEHMPKVDKDGPEWQVDWLRDDTAVLKMPTWALYNSKWNWTEWLQARFEELKTRGTKNLIIDLRGNGGGNECGDTIMRYLVPGAVSFPSGTTFVRYQKIPDSLAMYVSTWDRSYYDWTSASKPAQHVSSLNSKGFQIRSEDSVNAERGGRITPLEPRFQGQVYVLVDAECSSATFQFSQQVRNYKVAKLVGQPTGGNAKGINGGAMFNTLLPNSQIEIDIPIIAYLPSSPQPDAGLRPDVEIWPTREDLAKGRDAVMNWVLNQVGNSRGTGLGSGR